MLEIDDCVVWGRHRSRHDGPAVAGSEKRAGCKKAPSNSDISTWRFEELINVSIELQLIGRGAEKLSHSVRQYRNLIHLIRESNDGLTIDAHEARIALAVLHMIDRDLS